MKTPHLSRSFVLFTVCALLTVACGHGDNPASSTSGAGGSPTTATSSSTTGSGDTTATTSTSGGPCDPSTDPEYCQGMPAGMPYDGPSATFAKALTNCNWIDLTGQTEKAAVFNCGDKTCAALTMLAPAEDLESFHAWLVDSDQLYFNANHTDRYNCTSDPYKGATLDMKCRYPDGSADPTGSGSLRCQE